MSSLSFLYFFVSILSLLFLIVNFFFALHNPYQEKYSIFECGFHSFLGQNRIQFGVKFFIFALVYLLLDLEIILTYPFALSGYVNNFYGFFVVLIFIVMITIGFIFEVGKSALAIESKQVINSILNRKRVDLVYLRSSMCDNILSAADFSSINKVFSYLSNLRSYYQYFSFLIIAACMSIFVIGLLI